MSCWDLTDLLFLKPSELCFGFFECLEIYHGWNKTILHPFHRSFGEITSIVSQNTYFRTRDTLLEVSNNIDKHNIDNLPWETYEWNSWVPSTHEVLRVFSDVVKCPYMKPINYTYDLLSTDWFRKPRGWTYCLSKMADKILFTGEILLQKYMLAMILRRINKFPRHASMVESVVDASRRKDT